nr:hypothetical protein [Tanacetum cinerariifolium]
MVRRKEEAKEQCKEEDEMETIEEVEELFEDEESERETKEEVEEVFDNETKEEEDNDTKYYNSPLLSKSLYIMNGCWRILKLLGLCQSKISFHQALDLIFELDEMTVGCTRDILRQSDCLGRLSGIPWVVLTFVVIEGEIEILHDVVGTSGYHCEFCGPCRWKELSKESGSKILPCGDGSCWKMFKPIANLIAKGKLK